MKSNKGITLIALIITIIILLILATVTIKISVNSGLIGNAQTATDKTKVDIVKEQLTNVVMGTIKSNGKVDGDKLTEKVKALGGSITEQLDFGWEVTIGEETYIINNLAEVTKKTAVRVINGLAYVIRSGSAIVYGNRGENYLDYLPGKILEIKPTTSGNVEILNSVVIDCQTYEINEIASNAFDSAYGGAGELEKIIIPNSITKIGQNAFSECHKLNEIVIPTSVIEMGEGVFKFWTEDQTIKVYWNKNEKPDRWDENWNENCSANIIYGYTE